MRSLRSAPDSLASQVYTKLPPLDRPAHGFVRGLLR